MKRLFVSVTIVLLLAIFCSQHTFYLQALTDSIKTEISDAQSSLKSGNWDSAARKIEAAFSMLSNKAFYLHTTLHHADIDAIKISFSEVMSYLSRKEDATECIAASSKLIAQLSLLAEAERPSIANIL